MSEKRTRTKGGDPRIMALYRRLFAHFGPRHWWPADSPFEVVVGAVLAQNTSWAQAAKAVGNLKALDDFSVAGLLALPPERLAGLIRPAGYYNLKQKRLRNLLEMLARECGGRLEILFKLPLDQARKKLLAVKGVGPETADSILLYAGGLPVFVIDAYTARILKRHGLAKAKPDYHDLQRLFSQSLPADSDLFNEFHACLVGVGHRFCKPKKPLCQDCPALGWAGGPDLR